LAISAGAFVNVALPIEGQARLDVADHLAAGAVGIKDLIEEGKDGLTQAEDALAAVGVFVGGGEQARGQDRGQQQFQLAEAVLAEVPKATTEVGEALAKGWKERSVH